MAAGSISSRNEGGFGYWVESGNAFDVTGAPATLIDANVVTLPVPGNGNRLVCRVKLPSVGGACTSRSTRFPGEIVGSGFGLLKFAYANCTPSCAIWRQLSGVGLPVTVSTTPVMPTWTCAHAFRMRQRITWPGRMVITGWRMPLMKTSGSLVLENVDVDGAFPMALSRFKVEPNCCRTSTFSSS